jgi:hypothetical protein
LIFLFSSVSSLLEKYLPLFFAYRIQASGRIRPLSFIPENALSQNPPDRRRLAQHFIGDVGLAKRS